MKGLIKLKKYTIMLIANNVLDNMPFTYANTFNNNTKNKYKAQNNLFDDLLNKRAKMAVVGLGYVGLPLALEFASSFSVIGFDIKQDRVNLMKKSIDPSGELKKADFFYKYIDFTARSQDLAEAKFYVVAVPTPVDANKNPNLNILKSATEMVAKVLKRGDYVVFESTVYPGCTEEVCVPILEDISGLKLNKDFKIGYSPERINPGDKKHTLTSITKIVSGSDAIAQKMIADVYDLIIEPGVHIAPSIKVAEAAKIVENTQRDVNIALMNELSMIFDKMGINTHDVLAAAGTKWNFLKFYPGLVGGHCIGVDPYYLAYKAEQLGVRPNVILSSRQVNDWMPTEIAYRLFAQLAKIGKTAASSRILVRGITFKEDVQDIRNSKVAEMIQFMKSQGVDVVVEDPYAIPEEVKSTYQIELTEQPTGKFDAVIVAVAHQDFLYQNFEFYRPLFANEPILFDLRNIVKNVPTEINYQTL